MAVSWTAPATTRMANAAVLPCGHHGDVDEHQTIVCGHEGLIHDHVVAVVLGGGHERKRGRPQRQEQGP